VPFGWDNEFPEHRVHVPAFEIDSRPVTNDEWMGFVEDGGYDDARLWRPEDWTWRTRASLGRPHSWRLVDDRVNRGERRLPAPRIRSLLEDVPFETAAAWPVMVSWAEANAYAQWRGARLHTEPEWQRAAYGDPAEGASVRPAARWPWGDVPPSAVGANVGFRHGSPVAAGSAADAASAWGILDLVGSGWEWTGSPFEPFRGFHPLSRYPGYSADFFDGRHFVLLGGSWATDATLLRRSFRNWFQPHYPYVFSKLRCAR
jgi:formylglycine-generating enzyme required for sulfatase activity